MAEDVESSISDESKQYLELAKKGKPLKFAMICKGTAVVSLVVFKKGSVEKRRKEAKEKGKGQFYFGAINGRGMDLQFTMARADGFESEPVKNSVLKAYLDEAAGMKCKPTFVIVDQLDPVLDDDDPLVKQFLELKAKAANASVTPENKQLLDQLCIEIPKHFELEENDAAAQKITQLSNLLSSTSTIPEPPPPPPVPPTPSTGTPTDKLKEALAKLKPLMEQALALQPQRKAELLGAMKLVKESIDAGQAEQAQADLIKLGKELKAIVAAASSTAPVAPTADPAKATYEQLLPEVSELITKAGAIVPEKLAVYQKIMQLATASAGKGEFSTALTSLEKLKGALEPLVNQQGSGGDDPASQYEMRMAALEPQLLKVLSEMTGDSSKLRAVSEFAREKAAKGDFTAALKALDRLEPMVEQASAAGAPKETDVIAKGIVAAMKAKLEAAKESWDSGVRLADAEVSKFRAAIQGEQPELAQALGVTMDIYRGRLDSLAAQAAKLDSAPDATTAQVAIRQALYLLGDEVEDDELLTQFATHEKVQVDVVSPLLNALEQIEKSIASS